MTKKSTATSASKVLSCISRGDGMTFEDAIYTTPMADYCQRNGIEHSNFDINHWNTYTNKPAVTFTYLYRTINERQPDVVILPITNNQNTNLVLDPTRVNCKVVYLFTGDLGVNRSVVQLIPEEFYIVCHDRAQTKYVQSKRKHNIVELFPVLNNFAFYRDDAVMQEEQRSENDANRGSIEVNQNQHTIDVSLFGSYNQQRHDFLKYIAGDCDVRAFGVGWWDEFFGDDVRDGIKLGVRKNLAFQRQILTRSRLCVVVSNVLKSIHFEAAACNALPVVYDEVGEIQEYFPGVELPTFRTKTQLRKLVKDFLKNDERRESVRRGIQKYIEDHYTSDHYFSGLFTAVE